MVSILVPVYGVEKYIEKCAVSLFEQTCNDIEYVFVDDCSPDNSIGILEEVRKRYPERDKVKIIRHDRNRGLAAARKTALMASVGDYVIHVDSDDWVSPDMVATLAEQAMKTGADLVDGNYYHATDSRVVKEFRHFEGRTEINIKLLVSSSELVDNRIWGRLMRRSLIVDNAIFHQEGVDYAEDFSVVPQVLYLAKRAAVDAYVYYYRVDNSNSYTHSISDKNLVSLMKAHTMVYDFFRSTADFNSYKTDLAFGIENVFKTAVLNKREPSSLIDYLPADYDCGPFSIYHKLIFSRDASVRSMGMIYYKVVKTLRYRPLLLLNKVVALGTRWWNRKGAGGTDKK